MDRKDLLKDPFVSMVVYAFLGGIAGIFGGLFLSYILIGVASSVVTDLDVYLDPGGIQHVWAMVVGVMIGGFLGGIAGIKKSK